VVEPAGGRFSPPHPVFGFESGVLIGQLGFGGSEALRGVFPPKGAAAAGAMGIPRSGGAEDVGITLVGVGSGTTSAEAIGVGGSVEKAQGLSIPGFVISEKCWPLLQEQIMLEATLYFRFSLHGDYSSD